MRLAQIVVNVVWRNETMGGLDIRGGVGGGYKKSHLFYERDVFPKSIDTAIAWP